jgi:hypothetical protein
MAARFLVSLDSLLQQGSKIGPNSESSTGELTVTRDKAYLAKLWVAAWNAHDSDLIMTHYDDAVELTSPVAAQLLGSTDGKVVGKPNLRAYFQRGLEAYPELHFRLDDVLWGVNSVVLCYKNQKGTSTAECMELSEVGQSGTSCGELQCAESWLPRLTSTRCDVRGVIAAVHIKKNML